MAPARMTQWLHLHQVEYADGLAMQQHLQALRKQSQIDDTLLLLEHSPVLTLGRGAHATNIIAPQAVLQAEGVRIFETDRGGDVTYHGPGQLVGYPLLHLGPGRQDVRKYVRAIEEIAIRTVADFGIVATRLEKWPGVWVEQSRRGGPRKICALGVHLSRWYTRHGFALNVQPNLAHFGLIVPCGISEAGVTSMAEELNRDVTRDEVEPRVVHHFSQVFETQMREVVERRRTVSVTVVTAGPEPRVLVLQRLPARGGHWQQVTGHVEPGESARQAAERELREETGLTGIAVNPLGYVHEFTTEQTGALVTEETAFVARVPHERNVVWSDTEHLNAQWVSPAEALTRVPHAGLAEAISRAVRHSA